MSRHLLKGRFLYFYIGIILATGEEDYIDNKELLSNKRIVHCLLPVFLSD